MTTDSFKSRESINLNKFSHLHNVDENSEEISKECKSLKRDKEKIEKLESAISKKRTDVIKWNGWGYNDSQFIVKDDVISFTGKRS